MVHINQSYVNFIKLATQIEIENSEAFLKIKKDLCKKLGLPLPTNADIRELYNQMLADKKIKKSSSLEKALFTKRIRTQSGVAVIAVLTKPYPCTGKCIYCPSEKAMPKSYLSNEPAVMRAISANFSPYKQVQRRIKALELNGHKTDKIELIVMGGTFSCLPKAYQINFITQCFKACNDYDKKTIKSNKKTASKKLEYEQKRNEQAERRIVGLTLETRPDYVNPKELANFRKLGCTRVEIGVQSIFDDVLKINKRGHTVQETIKATRLLKNLGFKINYHIMPGLLGSTSEKDFEMFRELFNNPDFQPDMLKIYPTVVIKQSSLYKLWKTNKYQPLNEEAFENFILKVKNEIIPPYVRIARLIRDVPTESIEAGPRVSNLRQIISEKSTCPCIRCREVRSEYQLDEEIFLNRIDYLASDGKEIFLEYVSKNKKKLFALLRLRVPSADDQEVYNKFPVLKNSAIIREVHTYGKVVEINNKEKKSLPASLREALQVGPQHIGLGKKLIFEAEKIAREEFDSKKIVVISGVGVRGYYRKLGYKLKDGYMAKEI